jgi:hypothetical protein
VPIRTHRGRAAVYRKFWGWPVRSPAHLAGTLLVAVIVAVGIGAVLPGKHRDGTVRGAQSSSSRVTASAPAPASALDGSGGLRATLVPARPTSPAPAAALSVARSWVQAFLTVGKGTTSAQWVEQLRPLTTDDLVPELRSVDPANVPAAQIIEAPRTISASAGSAEVDVPTTALVMRLLVVSTPAGWRVASYERAN